LQERLWQQDRQAAHAFLSGQKSTTMMVRNDPSDTTASARWNTASEVAAAVSLEEQQQAALQHRPHMTLQVSLPSS